jgi:hypothetical protein
MRGRLARMAAPAALGVALLSLALNLYLIRQIRSPERWIDLAAGALAERLGGEGGVLRYTVRVPPGTPLALDIPVDERFTIRVDTVIPVNTRVRVPFDTPLGRRSISVPLRANVPLRTRLPLQLRHTFELRTRTTQEIAIPLEIRLDELLR